MVSGQQVEFINPPLSAILTLTLVLKRFNIDENDYFLLVLQVKAFKWLPPSNLSSFKSRMRARLADKGGLMNSTYLPETMLWRP